MIAFYEPHGISTVYDYVTAWQRASRLNIAVLNLWPLSGSPISIPPSVDLDDFDGIIVHPTIAYSPENLFALDTRIKMTFDAYTGVKILVKQDEHICSARWAEFIAAKKFDVLVTCLSPEEVRKVYPRDIVGDLEIVHALTGYVPQHFRDIPARPLRQRPIDISYRGSIQPLFVGRLGFEKRQIGYAVEKAMANAGLNFDISSRPEDRIHGSAWFDFLGSSRIVLGTESGSNLFDFDGSVAHWCQEYATRNRNLDKSGEEYYYKAHHEFLNRFEGNVSYATISPRHLEAAATRSVQVLYEGRYSGIFEPYRHYLPLKRDLSNLDELLDFVRDEQQANRLTEAAFEEIIKNNRFTYERFVSQVDDVAERLLAQRRAPASAPTPLSTRPRALLLMSHDPDQDPRIEWMSRGLRTNGFDVVELGTYRFTQIGPSPSLEHLVDGRIRVRVERKRHDYAMMPTPFDINRGLTIGQQQILMILGFVMLPNDVLAKRIGAIDVNPETIDRFRFLCLHFVNTNSALLQAARQIGVFDVVIACDLDTMPAAQTLATEYSAVLAYDAHEYWPHSHQASRHWEREFWGHIDRALAPLADIRSTVSTPLAEEMAKDYGVFFQCVPNCALVEDACKDELLIQRREKRKRRQTVTFLYQGAFARGRNLESLIAAWPGTDKRAILWLRGPHWHYADDLKALARQTGLLDKRIFFHDAVVESQLVSAAAEADVGIIPYDPADINNRFACPNKFSQYLAAGLPIISTPIKYVSSLVRANDLGAIFDFAGSPSLADAVNSLLDEGRLFDCSTRARQYFLDEFNWETVSRPFYEELRACVGQIDILRTRPDLDFAWISNGRTMRDFAIQQYPSFVHHSGNVESKQVSVAPAVAQSSYRFARAVWHTLPVPARRRIRAGLEALLSR
ncbi:glycosyltransferase family 4 protein [Bradyrhizobium sp. BWA-3-5]|uniref:glycosyltransferase family 4 protein n=1 Tax=Bradyrhizobium sp. BWA-3-5 TaxID=3080013 RepID=UPI00293E8C95|nr:glycosyltransferase family 4 protein [Bradyrhizobium sp. BWA-3-5]WOH68183.1 glycosyltransferase family 4 protein [Bradyrhizobium sp. BWA-3-5]